MVTLVSMPIICQGSFEELHCVLVARPGEISGLAFDSASNHLALCNRNSVIQLFTVDGLMTPRIKFSITVADFVPKAIAFGLTSGDTRALLAFGMYDGQMRVHFETLYVTTCLTEHTDIHCDVMGVLNTPEVLVDACK